MGLKRLRNHEDGIVHLEALTTANGGRWTACEISDGGSLVGRYRHASLKATHQHVTCIECWTKVALIP